MLLGNVLRPPASHRNNKKARPSRDAFAASPFAGQRTPAPSQPPEQQRGTPLAGRVCCFSCCWATYSGPQPATGTTNRRAPRGMRLLLLLLLGNVLRPPASHRNNKKACPSRDVGRGTRAGRARTKTGPRRARLRPSSPD
ncbi:hypothetical protein NDU88_008318 [Pleurodeles waltl]|uniref:Uncharacterized protein n=1 Tax=Pleurodeles waltl TaxID=8319 RepID=A0AAV7RTG2_PLEWA|nr:hypothetical protein NDU88_008318 [Pleurodeles waltl]